LRLSRLPSWDLTASALISVIALFLIHLSPPSIQGFSTILGFLLAIPFPGYLLMLSLFPAKSDLGSQRRALLSLGVSVFLVALVSLVLITRRLQISDVATILSLMTLFLAAVAYVRWSALPRRRRFILRLMIGSRYRRTPASSHLVDAGERVGSLLNLGSLRKALLSLGTSTFLAAIAYVHRSAQPPRKRLVVRSMKSRKSGRFLASSPLASTKGQFVSLLFVLIIICAITASVFTNYANQSSSSEKVKKGDSASPYREDHLWINSLDIKSNNSSQSKASLKGSPVIVDQKNMVVVEGMNNGSSSGNSTSSGEEPSFPESNEKISTQGGSSGGSNQQNIGEPSSNETAGSLSLESSKENQTANPASLQENKSEEELALSSSSPAVSSNDKALSLGANTTGDENKTDISRENQTYNFPPILADLRPDKPNPQIVGTTIIWTANASDMDGDLVLFKFLINDQPATIWTRFNTFNWVTAGMTLGDYRIKVLIRDGKHASEDSFDGSKEVTFALIQPNQIPVLEDLRSDLGSPQASGKSIVWTANATDPDKDRIFYRFLLNDKAMTDWADSNSWTWNTSSVSPGDYRIKVLIRDGKHASEDSFDDSKEVTFALIKPNYIPTIEDLRPDLSSPQPPGKSIVWTANATDPDGDQVLYKFFVNDQPTTVWLKFNTFDWVTTRMPPGDYRVKVLIRDGKHASEDSFDASKEVTFTLAQPNQRPVLEDLRSDINSPQPPGKSIVWTANAADPYGDLISYKFLLNDEAMTDWSHSNSWTWNTSSVAPGDYRIKVLIRDGKHTSEDSFDASKEATFTLLAPNRPPVLASNRPPVLKSLRPFMDSPHTPRKSIVWMANGVDPDGDRIFYRFFLNDKSMTDWAASNSWTWNTSSVAPGDYRIKVLIRDGKHASENAFDDSMETTFTIKR